MDTTKPVNLMKNIAYYYATYFTILFWFYAYKQHLLYNTPNCSHFKALLWDLGLF